MAKCLVKIDYCAIPNLLAEHEMVPEFIQNEATPAALAQSIQHWLTDNQARTQLLAWYDIVRKPFEGDASERAADAIEILMGLG